jgi:hypothetical protein
VLLEELLARNADAEDRSATLVGQVLDQLEERGLRPVEVVEDEDERLLPRERLAELAKAERDLGRGKRRLRIQSGQCSVALPTGGRLVDDLAQGPVRDAVAVGQTASPEHPVVLRPPRELGDQSRLADPCLADDDGDLRRRPVDGALQGTPDRSELALAPHECRLASLEGR